MSSPPEPAPSAEVLMPPAVCEVFDLLYNDIANIHANWLTFRQLFGTDPARIDLLNRFAGFAFGVIQRVLYNETVLALSRLTDPAAQGTGRENLSLERLVEAVADADGTPLNSEGQDARTEAGETVSGENAGPASFTAQVQEELTGLNARCAALRRLRNRRIAHRDYRAARELTVNNNALPGPSRQEIEDALVTVRRVMNRVSLHYHGPEIGFQEVILPPGSDGDSLIRHLADLARRLDDEGHRCGRPRPPQLAGL